MGITTTIVTHDTGRGAVLWTRFAEFLHGKLQQYDTPMYVFYDRCRISREIAWTFSAGEFLVEYHSRQAGVHI